MRLLKIFTTLFIIGISGSLFGQLQVNTGSMNATQYAQHLMGGGVTISNATFTATSSTQIATFANGNTTNLGLDEGLVISTGHTTNIPGPVPAYGQVGSALAGGWSYSDPDLVTISENNCGGCYIQANDAATLEFDFVPDGNNVSFEFIFGSSEYPTWVNSSYNDVFGFFLSGPGISGPYTNSAENIALVPGTNTELSINTINGGTGCPQNGGVNSSYFVDNCGGSTIAYRGFTTVITAERNLICGETYHIKLVIADIDDGNWDSGVFIKRSSFVSNEIEIDVSANDICPGDNVTLEASISDGDTGGTYTWQPGNHSGSTITVSPTTETTYTVTYSKNGCDMTKDITIRMDEDCEDCDIVADASSNGTTFCEGDNLSLTAATVAGATYSWSGPNGFTSSSQNPTINGVTMDADGTYTLTVTKDDCEDTDEVTITVNPLPNAGTISGDTEVCVGNSITLSSNGDAGGTWTVNNTNVTIDPATGELTGVNVGSVEVTYTVTNSCGNDDDTFTVDVIDVPFPDVNDTRTLCEGTTTTIFIPTGEQGGTWTTSDASVATINNGVISGVSGGTATIIYTLSNDCGTSTRTYTVTVNPLPNAGDIDGEIEVCIGNSITLDSDGDNDGVWTVNNTNATIDPNTGELTGVNTGTVEVTYTVTNSCGTDDTQHTVTIVNKIVPTFTNPGPICEGESFTLPTTSNNGVVGTWSPAVDNMNTTTYTFTPADDCADPMTMEVVVNPDLEITSVIGVNPTTCEGGDGEIIIGVFDANTSYDVTYLENGVTVGPISITSDGDGNIIIDGLSSGVVYQGIQVSNGDCSDTYIGRISLEDPEKPVVSAGEDLAICEGESVTLTAENPDGAVITWNNGVQDGVAFEPTATTTYTVTAELNNCFSTDVVTVTVKPNPTVDAGDDVTVCAGGVVTLSAENPDGANISWDNGAIDGETFTPSTGSTTYTVTAELDGCVTTDEVTVTVNPLPTFALTSTNPTTCGGTDGRIVISGLDANSDYEVSYNNGTSVSYTTDGNGDIILEGLSAGSYNDITVEINDCSTTSSQNISLTDPSAPTIDAGEDVTICEGESVQLVANNPQGANISWNDGYNNGDWVSPTSTTTYTVEAELNGCTSSSSITVTVKPNPTVNAGTDIAVCDGEGVTLTADNPDNATITWDNGITDGVEFVPTVTTTYTVTADLDGCISTDEITVTVKDLPTYTVTGTDPETCGGDEGTITISGLTPFTEYEVSYNNGTTESYTTNAAGEILIDELTAGSYTDFVVSLDDCSTESNVNISLSDPDAPEVDAGEDIAVCDGEIVVLTASNPDNANISWDNGITDGVSFTPTSTTIYTVTAELNGCTSSSTVTVTVKPLPVVDAGEDIAVCDGESVTLTADNPNDAIITWDNGVVDGEEFIPTTTTTYTVTADLDGCVSTDEITVTVKDLPTYTVSGTDPATCGGDEGTITISGLEPNTEYEVGYDGEASVSITTDAAGEIVISDLTAGSYTDFIVTLNDCSTESTETVVLTDPNAPEVDAGEDIAVCDGESVTLTASNPDNANISWNNGVVDGDEFTPTSTTIYTVTAELNGCTSTSSVTVTVKPLPVVDAGEDIAVCDGESVTLTATYDNGAAITWDNGVVDGEGFIPTETTTYTVTADLDGCTSTDQMTVTVKDLPEFEIVSQDPTECGANDGEITISGLEGDTDYEISINGADVISVTTNAAGEIIIDTLTAGTYTDITVSLEDCATVSTETVSLSDPDAPEVSAGDNVTICAGESVILNATATAGATITWDDGYSNDDEVSPTETTTYTVTAVLDGCTSTSSVTVTVNPLPVVDAGEDITICDGETVTLTADATSGAIISWDNGVVDGEGFIPTETTTYTVTVDLDGCISTDDITVTVNDLPEYEVTSSNPSECGADDGSITISGLEADTEYEVSLNGEDAETLTANADGEIIIDGLTQGSYGDFTVTLNGCTTESDATVTLVDPNAPEISIPEDLTICEGEGVVLSASNPDNANITWDNGVVDGEVVFPTETTTYTVTAELDGCTTTASITITVNEMPDATFSGLEDLYCLEDGSVTLTVTDDSGTFDGPGMIGNTFSPSLAGPGTHTITYTIDNNGCADEMSVDVTVDYFDGLYVEDTDISGCPGIEVVLEASGAETYTWYGPNGFEESGDNVIIKPATVNHTGTYYVFATGDNGCSTMDSVLVDISIDDCLEVNDFLSPNGDGMNDTWIIQGIENYPNSEIMIFNRWGNLIYEATNYLNDWEGQVNRGAIVGDGNGTVPAGTYFYIIKLNDDANTEPIKGYLELQN